MIHLDLFRQCRRAAVLFVAALTLLPACGSSDQRPLVLVDAPLGTNAGDGRTVRVTVTPDNGPPTVKEIPSLQDPSGKLGIYLPAGSSGNVTIKVDVIGASGGCVVASGTVTSVSVKAGETTAAVAISLSEQGPCTQGDGGASDAVLLPPADGGIADGPGATGPEVSGNDALSAPDAPADGPLANSDGPLLGKDVATPDLTLLPDAQADLPTVSLDVPAEAPAPDTRLGPDFGPDGPVDGAFTTMNVFGHCATYTHSTLTSTGTPGDFVVRQVIFTPDGRNLVSLGDDGRGKVWNVTSSGLEAPPNGVVFSGNGKLSGAIRSDGKYLAVGDGDGLVTVYDFGASLSSGAAASLYELPVDALPTVPLLALPRGFTTDGNYLLVAYSAYYYGDSNQLAIWNLSTQKIVRVLDYGVDDWPTAFLPGSSSGPMWVASAATVNTDAGDYLSVVTLMDVAQSSPSKAQFSIPGTVNRIAFSPDGTTLAITVDTGEVGLWDITNKASITRLGSPLIAGSASGSSSADPIAYAPDGKYVAAGIIGVTTSSIKIVSIQLKQTLQKSLDYDPFSVSFSPDGLGIAVGENGLGRILYCTP
jgi:hypothetical protein